MLIRNWFLFLLFVYLTGIQALPLSSLVTTPSIPTVFARDATDSSSGSSRTLYSIVRSCILTILACVYRAIHPNIPSPAAGKWRTLRERLIIMAYTLLVPELVIYWAAEQWCSAREIAHSMNVEITKKLATKEQQDEWIARHKWTTVHGHFIQMGGFIREDGSVMTCKDIIALLTEHTGPITAADLRLYSEKHIRDKSKGDILSKVILTLQTSWFLIQCVARLAQHLDLSELEVVTFAYSILNIVTFILWSNKPLDIHCSIPFKLPGTQTVPNSTPLPEVEKKVPSSADNPPTTFLANLYDLFQHPFVRFFSQLGQLVGFIPEAYEITGNRKHVGRFYRERPDHYVIRLFLGTASLGVAFGAIHFMSWSFPFPTRQEQILWRIFTIVATCFPVTFVVLGLAIFEVISTRNKGFILRLLEGIVGAVLVLAILFYALARLGLVVQALVALRKLPPGVFENVTWSSFFPHF